MNRAFRIVWSHVRNCFVVVGENAKARGKVSKSKKALAAAAAVVGLAGTTNLAQADIYEIDTVQAQTDTAFGEDAFATNAIAGSPAISDILVNAFMDANAVSIYDGESDNYNRAVSRAFEVIDNNVSVTVNNVPDSRDRINEIEATSLAFSDTLAEESAACSVASGITAGGLNEQCPTFDFDDSVPPPPSGDGGGGDGGGDGGGGDGGGGTPPPPFPFSTPSASPTPPSASVNLGDVIINSGAKIDIVSTAYAEAGRTSYDSADEDVYAVSFAAGHGVITEASLEGFDNAGMINVDVVSETQALITAYTGGSGGEDSYATSYSLATGVYVGNDISDPQIDGRTGIRNSGSIDVSSSASAGGYRLTGLNSRPGPIANLPTVFSPVTGAAAAAEAYGIFIGDDVRSRTTLSGFINSGSITAVASSEAISGTTNNTQFGDLAPYGEDVSLALAAGLSVGGDIRDIENSGAITAEANARSIASEFGVAIADSRGIFVAEDATGLFTNSATGVIRSTAVAQALSGDAMSGEDGSADYAIAGASGLQIDGDLGLGSNNQGSIIASSSATADALGFSVAVSGDSLGDISSDEPVVGPDPSLTSVSAAFLGPIGVGGPAEFLADQLITVGEDYAPTAAIYVGGDVGGNMVNSGTLSATATASTEGLFSLAISGASGVEIGGDLNGQITNSGFIGAEAISSAKQSIDIGEDGSVDIALAEASGYRVFGDVTGGIVNSGTISGIASATSTVNSDNVEALAALVLSSAQGVLIGEDVSGGINNSGSIIADSSATANALGLSFASSGDVSADAPVGGPIFGPIGFLGEDIAPTVGIYVGGNVNGNTVNSGLVSVTSNASAEALISFALSGATGVQIGGDLNGRISNSGSILVESIASATQDVDLGEDGSVDIALAQAAGVRVDGDITGGVVNSGTISAIASSSTSAADGDAAAVSGVAATFASGLSVGEDVAGGINNQAGGLISAQATSLSHSSENPFVGEDISSDISSDVAIARAEGIIIEGALSGGLTNAGVIQASATASLTGDADDYPFGGGDPLVFADAFAVGVQVDGGISGGITTLSTGRIIAEAKATVDANIDESNANAYSDASGITTFGSVQGGISNAGVISATATASLTNPVSDLKENYAYAYATGIAIEGTLSGGLTNAATGQIIANAISTNDVTGAREAYAYAIAAGVVVSNLDDANNSVPKDSDGEGVAVFGGISNSGLIAASASATNSLVTSFDGVVVDVKPGSLAIGDDDFLGSSVSFIASGSDADSTSLEILGDLSGNLNNEAGARIIGSAISSNSLQASGDSYLQAETASGADLEGRFFYSEADASGKGVNLDGSLVGSLLNAGTVAGFASALNETTISGGIAYARATDGNATVSYGTDSGAPAASIYAESSADAEGFEISGTVTGSVTNAATGLVSAQALAENNLSYDSNGLVAAVAYAENGSASVFAEIEADADAEAYAFDIDQVNGSITNAGRVVVVADSANSLEVAGDLAAAYSGSEGVQSLGDGGGTTNLSLYLDSEANSSAYGFYIESGVTGDLLNEAGGSITMQADARSNLNYQADEVAAYASGEDFDLNVNATVDFYSGATSNAYGFDVDGSVGGQLSNGGAISALANAEALQSINGNLLNAFAGEDGDISVQFEVLSDADATAKGVEISGDLDQGGVTGVNSRIAATSIANSQLSLTPTDYLATVSGEDVVGEGSELELIVGSDAFAVASGVEINGDLVAGGFNNAGTIAAQASATSGLTLSGGIADLSGVYDNENDDDPLVSVYSYSFADARGLLVRGGGFPDVSIESFKGDLTNAGTISGLAVANASLSLSANQGEDFIAGSGDLEAEVYSYAYAVARGVQIGDSDQDLFRALDKGQSVGSLIGNVINSGEISAVASADASSTISGVISNDGEDVDGGTYAYADARALDVSGDVTGSITNSTTGSISAVAVANTQANSSDSGSGWVSDAESNATAIAIDIEGSLGVTVGEVNDTFARGLVNSGAVSAVSESNSSSSDAEAWSEAYSAGLYVADEATTVENLTAQSSIRATAMADAASAATNAYASVEAYAVYVGEDLGSLTNAGTIAGSSMASSSAPLVSGSDAIAYGVYVGEDLGGFSGANTIANRGDITNSGGISAQAVALARGVLDEAGDVSEKASNSYATAYASAITVLGQVDGTITNSGSITAVANAQALDSKGDFGGEDSFAIASAGGVVVFGSIGIDDSGATTVYSNGVVNSGTIVSSATAVLEADVAGEDTYAYANAWGIYSGYDGQGQGVTSIENSGAASRISATAISSVKAEYYDWAGESDGESSSISNAYAVFVGGDLGSLSNNGTISSSAVAQYQSPDGYASSYAFAYGVAVTGSVGGIFQGSGLSGVGNVTNSGSITASAVAQASGLLDDSGEIVTQSKDANSVAHAISLHVRGSIDGTLTNSGSISAFASADSIGDNDAEVEKTIEAYAYATGVMVDSQVGSVSKDAQDRDIYSGGFINTSTGFISATAIARAESVTDDGEDTSPAYGSANAVGVSLGTNQAAAGNFSTPSFVNDGSITATAMMTAIATSGNALAGADLEASFDTEGVSAHALLADSNIGTFSNSGTMSGTAVARAETDGSDETDSFANAYAYAYGVMVKGSIGGLSNISPSAPLVGLGDFTNSGLITANASSWASGLVESGTVTGRAADANALAEAFAIDIEGSIDGDFINAQGATVRASATTYAFGLGEELDDVEGRTVSSDADVDALYVTGSVVGELANSGTISASALASSEATSLLFDANADADASARAININEDVGTFSNLGAESEVVGFASSIATANGGEASANSTARGVDIEGDLDGFTNQGLINAQALSFAESFGTVDAEATNARSYGRAVVVDDRFTGVFENTGEISGFASATAQSIDIDETSGVLDAYALAYATGFRVGYDLVGSLVNGSTSISGALISAAAESSASGDLEVSAGAYAHAIFIGDNEQGNLGLFDAEGDSVGELKNYGRIIASAEATSESLLGDSEANAQAYGVYIDGDTEYYDSAFNGEDITIINNLGANSVISATAISSADAFGTTSGIDLATSGSTAEAFSFAAGIYLEDEGVGHKSLTNEGTISGAAQADSRSVLEAFSDADAYAVYIEGSLATLTSSGKIESLAIANAETLLSGEDFVSATAIADSFSVFVGEDLGSMTVTNQIIATARASAFSQNDVEGVTPTEALAEASAYGVTANNIGSLMLGTADSNDNALIQAVAVASAVGTENSVNNADDFASGRAVASAVGVLAGFINSAEVHGRIVALANASSVGDEGALIGSLNGVTRGADSAVDALGIDAGRVNNLLVGVTGSVSADANASATGESNVWVNAVAIGVSAQSAGAITNEGIIQASSTVTGSVESGDFLATAIARGVSIGQGTGDFDGEDFISIEGDDFSTDRVIVNNIGNFQNGKGVISAHVDVSMLSGGTQTGAIADSFGVDIENVGEGFFYAGGEDELVLVNSGTIRGTGTSAGDFEPTSGSVRIRFGEGRVANLENALLDGQVQLGEDYGPDVSYISFYNAGTLDTRYDRSNATGDLYFADTGTLKIHARQNAGRINSLINGSSAEHGSIVFDGDRADLEVGTQIRVKVDHTFDNEFANHVFDVRGGGEDRLVGVIESTDNEGDIYIDGDWAGSMSQTQLESSIKVTDNYLAVNFVPDFESYEGYDRIDLVVEETGLTTVDAAVNSAGLDGMAGAGRVLDEMLKNPEAYKQGFHAINGNMHEYLYALGSSRDAKGVAEVVSQALPLISGGVAKATIGATRDALRVIDVRQDVLSGRASGDAGLEGDRGMWLKPFGSSATQSENDGIGFESKSSGIVIGADALYTPDTRLGVALVMSKGDVETESLATQEADVDTQQVVFYGNTALDDRTDVSYYLGFGMSDVEGRRTGSLLTGTLRSSFDSRSVFAGFDLGRTFQISEKASFRPSIRADYVSVKDDAYTETGASNMALSVRSQTTDSLVVGIDGKFSYAISDATKFTARLGIGADTIDDRAQATASFVRFDGSPSFLTEGAKSSSFLVNGGLGLVGRVSSNLEMSANLDFESGSDFKAQSFSVKARWSF